MNKKDELAGIILIICIFLISSSSAFQCYQESANSSTPSDDSCNLNYSGTYSSYLSFNRLDNETSVYDNDWKTGSYCNNSNAIGCSFVETYIKPKDFINTTNNIYRWRIYTDFFNNVIPQACQMASPVNISFRLYLGNRNAPSTQYSDYCWNGTSFVTLSTHTIFYVDEPPYIEMYETGIFWDVNSTTNFDINTPIGSYSSTNNIPVNISITNAPTLDKCWFNVTRGSTDANELNNTPISNCATSSFNVSSANDYYIFKPCFNITGGNITCTGSIFFVSSSSTTIIQGGGGSTSGELINASIFSTSYGDKIDLVLAKDSVNTRTKQILVVNYASQPITITLKCFPTNYSSLTEINICDYVNFSSTTFEVSPNELEPSYVNVYINTPEGADFGDYFNFNIIGDVSGYSLLNPKISASARVPVYALAFKYSYVPLTDPPEAYKYPVFPIALISAVIVFAIFYLIFRNLELTSIFISTIMFFATLILMLYLL